MKKGLILFAFVCCFAFAQSWTAIEESSKRLVQVIELELYRENQAIVEYLPGYGLHITFPPDKLSWFSTYASKEVVKSLESILIDLGGLVKGLPDKEWISVSYRNLDNTVKVLVKVQPANPNSITAWVNGTKQ